MASAAFSQRVRAASIDLIFLLTWLVVVALARPWPPNLPGWVRAAIWFAPILFAEPTYLCLFARTPGQALCGLRVTSTTGGYLSFPMLLARHASKLLFGGTAVIYALFSPTGQALHDHLFRTAVLCTANPPATPRVPLLQHPFRAFAVSLAWSASAGALAAIVFALAAGVALGLLGLQLPESGPTEGVLVFLMSAVYLYTQFRVLHRGMRAQLPGTGGLIAPAA